MVFVVACLYAFNAVSRYFFRHPFSFVTPIAEYMFCFSMFLCFGSTLQTNGLVGVDILRRFIDRHTPPRLHRVPVRTLALFGYLQALFYVFFLARGAWTMGVHAFSINSVTESALPLPQWLIYAFIVLGCVILAITILLIILTLFTDDDTYVTN